MKLYTEEQVREAIKMAREGVRSEDNIINSLNFIKPTIKLPTDEEIERKIQYRIDKEFKVGSLAFRDGAKWMRDKIQGGEQ
jgi:hypothetical protein